MKAPRVYKTYYGEINTDVKLYRTQYGDIPLDTLEEIYLYAAERVAPGSFVRAVLKNDLRNAIAAADKENLKALKAIVQYCHWEITALAWGNDKKFYDHLEKKDA